MAGINEKDYEERYPGASTPAPGSIEELRELVTSLSADLARLSDQVNKGTIGNRVYSKERLVLPSGRIEVGFKDEIIILDGQNPSFLLWAGAKNPASATFRLDRGGNIV